ncbi:RICIN domain-containing protein [Kitasatospora aureofaciens]|uniref:RICIN domain-containing protein n=1 Tax=Kitasatospora aureofaciens TaxID=1894 RepID=UPI003802EF77
MFSLFKRTAVATAAAALLATGSAALASPVNAAPVNAAPAKASDSDRLADTGIIPGTYYIKNVGTGRCLDAFYSWGGDNGNPVGLWDCNGGISEQWQISYTTSGGHFNMVMVNARSGRCLDYPGGAKGLQFRLWDCNGYLSQHFWPYYHSDTDNYEVSVESGGGGLDMDAYASDGGGNGNRVGLWDITGSPLQRWVFVQV